MSIEIRHAERDDLAAINAIYNHYVDHSTCTYALLPQSDAECAAWFERHGPAHPITVAVEAGVVIGWGSLSPFNDRCAYGRTVENSVYLRHDRLGRGIGRIVLDDLIRRAVALHHHTIIARISADQPASIALHERAGFIRAGCVREVGYKFDRWLDVVTLQRML